MKVRFHSILAVCFAISAPAFAARITVELTGHVIEVDDPSNLLGGQVSINQSASGSYSYDTTVIDGCTWSFESGCYAQGPAQGSLAVAVGALAFESDAASPYWSLGVNVRDQPWSPMSPWNASDSLQINSSTNKPVPGVPIDGYSINVEFTDFGGGALQSKALPAGAPNLSAFSTTRATVQCWTVNGLFQIIVQIDSVQNGGGNELTVSPGSGLFVPQQPIVPALVLPPGSSVIGIQGTFDSVDRPDYFSGCFASWSQTRTVFVCPEISQYLPPGMHHVEWRLQMGDGTIIAKVVDWELIQ